jgi:hypothetical protein
VTVHSPTAEQLHYPDCWDTAAFPTFLDAVAEASCFADAYHRRTGRVWRFRCSVCEPREVL